MSVSKWLKIFSAFFLLILCAVFYQPIAEGILGGSLKLFLRFKNDCHFAYRSVQWKEGRFSFFDVVAFDISGDKSAFRAYADKLELSFDWKKFPQKIDAHLALNRPVISICGQRNWKGAKSKWVDLCISAKEGILECEGIERAAFSYECTAPNHLGRLQLNWPDSALVLDAMQEGGETRIEAELRPLRAPLLRALVSYAHISLADFGSIEEGSLNGWIHLVLENGSPKRGSAHLEMERFAFQTLNSAWRDIDASFDWEGPCAFEKPKGLLKDAAPFSYAGRLRGTVSNLSGKADLAAVENVKGAFSYNSGMGMKWDLCGGAVAQAKSFPFHWVGSGYFHSQVANWVQSELECGGRISIRGHEFENRRVWEGGFDQIRSEHAAWLQTALCLFAPDWRSWQMAKGLFNGKGFLRFVDDKIDFWELSRLDAEEFVFKTGDLEIASAKAEGQISSEKGEVTLSGVDFHIPISKEKSANGAAWSGKCAWAGSNLTNARFSGSIEGVQTDLELGGSWKKWTAEAALSGLFKGALSLNGSWDGRLFSAQLKKGAIEELELEGGGSIDREGVYSIEIDRFRGKIDGLAKFFKHGSFKGDLDSLEAGARLYGDRNFSDWSFQARLRNGEIKVGSDLELVHAKMEILADSNEISCYGIQADLATPYGKIPIECPLFKKRGEEWAFDFRLAGKTWDLSRLCGKLAGHQFFFDEKSHFLGSPISFRRCELDPRNDLKNLDLDFEVSWEALLAASFFLRQLEWEAWRKAPLSGKAQVQFGYSAESGSEISLKGVDLKWDKAPLSLAVQALGREGEWKIDRCHFADLALECTLHKEEEIYRLREGRASWNEAAAVSFEGKFSSFSKFDLNLSKVRADLSRMNFLAPWVKVPLEGILEGEGHFTWNGGFESDFDLSAASLKVNSHRLENRGPLHLYFSSSKGAAVSGVDFHILKPSSDLPWLDCKIDLLEYAAENARWIFTRSHVHLPSDFWEIFPEKPAFLKPFDFHRELDFIADLDCSSDFSSLRCFMKEGFVSYGGGTRHLRDLHLALDFSRCIADFLYSHQGHLLKIGLDVDLESNVEGRLTLEEENAPLKEGQRPLTIDWKHLEGNRVAIHSIEGAFGGVDASFHAEESEEENRLIGSARLHCGVLSELVPPKIAEFFQELKMGAGYELKGRLSLGAKGPSFRGILSGKQFDLFGYQFRTLLAQIQLASEKVRIYDLKISDTAGMMKIDEVLLEGIGDQPWTISIPQLSILELRPSLLQRPGCELGELTPLVIREMKIVDLKGLLDETKTYKAKGELHFINSYKRESSVLDLPADVLSRIVGLDLDLLIPVCGTLVYELKDGRFLLNELKGSFSESKRSEFFLETGSGIPFMDLDGNLKILVKMKQFVLFKFTEAFLISIDGTLSDPKFHLQKKKRFLGI